MFHNFLDRNPYCRGVGLAQALRFCEPTDKPWSIVCCFRLRALPWLLVFLCGRFRGQLFFFFAHGHSWKPWQHLDFGPKRIPVYVEAHKN
jgi:hypothetical protein